MASHHFGSDRRKSGHGRRPLKMTFLTLNVTLLRDFVATQHGPRAAILTRKCSVSYSITSSAMASNLPHFEPE